MPLAGATRREKRHGEPKKLGCQELGLASAVGWFAGGNVSQRLCGWVFNIFNTGYTTAAGNNYITVNNKYDDTTFCLGQSVV